MQEIGARLWGVGERNGSIIGLLAGGLGHLGGQTTAGRQEPTQVYQRHEAKHLNFCLHRVLLGRKLGKKKRWRLIAGTLLRRVCNPSKDLTHCTTILPQKAFSFGSF